MNKKNEIAQIGEQLSVFEAICDGAEKIACNCDWQRLMQLLLVSSTVMFDDNTHLIFSMRSPADRVQKLLDRLGKCWRAVLCRTNEDLKIPKDSTTKEDLERFLLGCQKDLNEGSYAGAAMHLNQFRDSIFPFSPVEGEVEEFAIVSTPSNKKNALKPTTFKKRKASTLKNTATAAAHMKKTQKTYKVLSKPQTTGFQSKMNIIFPIENEHVEVTNIITSKNIFFSFFYKEKVLFDSI